LIRNILIALLLLASSFPCAPFAGLAVARPSPAAAQVVVTDVSVFYEPLARYGRWFHHSRYGYCWIPNGIVAGWRPYTNGYWVYTDDGWAWVSYEEWGWGPYHYGRWSFDPGYGWVWIPGTVWAPAWVAWRRGPGYIGWAPLPYEARWEVGVGLISFDYDRCIEPRWYCFVGERHFCDRYVERVIEVPARNLTIIHNTTYIINNYTIVNNHIVNRGITREEVQRATGDPVEVRHIREANSASEAGGIKVKSGDLMVYRPKGKGKYGPGQPGGGTNSDGTKSSDAESRKLEKQLGQELQKVQREQRKADKRSFSGGSTLELVKGKHGKEHRAAQDQLWTKDNGIRKAPAATYQPPKLPKRSSPTASISSSSRRLKEGKKH